MPACARRSRNAASRTNELTNQLGDLRQRIPHRPILRFRRCRKLQYRRPLAFAERMEQDHFAVRELERLFDSGYKARPERAILFTIEAWDVNCSSHIVARFTEADIEAAFAAIKEKIAALQEENAGLRAALAQRGKPDE